MNREVFQFLRDQTVETVAKLKRDQQRCTDHDVRRFLDYIIENIFDSSLALSIAYKKCKLKRRQFVPHFESIVGEKPKDYIQSVRVEAARSLLKKTSFTCDVIASLTGFTTGKALGEAFKKSFGVRPTEYRRQLLEKGEELPVATSSLLRRVKSGTTSNEEAVELQIYLQTHHPDIMEKQPEIHFHVDNRDVYSPTVYNISNETYERLRAERLWLRIKDLSIEDQKRRIRRAEEPFETPNLFLLLKDRSIEIGRESRSDGVNLAHLAVEAAIACEIFDKNGRSQIWAQAFVNLANAQRLAFELEDADRSFKLARLYLPKDPNPLVLGTLLSQESALRWYQKKPKEGLALVDKAIELIKERDAPRALAQAYISRGILSRTLNDFGSAVADYINAVNVLPSRSNPLLKCVARYNIALSRFQMGDLAGAKEEIQELRQVNEYVKSRQFRLHADWLDGRICLDRGELTKAESFLSASHGGFCVIGSKISALVGLDLAIANFLQRRTRRAIELAEEVLPILAFLKSNPEFKSSLKKLERAVKFKLVTLDDLISVRDLSITMLVDPAIRKDLDFTGIV